MISWLLAVIKKIKGLPASRFIKPSLVLFVVLLLIIAVGLFGCAQLSPLPQPDVAVTSKVFDLKGREIASVYRENREPVKLAAIAPEMADAIIAVEDANFYKHFGLDPIGIVRALVRNIEAGSVRQGGSTITQQTAKNLYLTNERTWTRKFKEAILTLKLEQNYTKDEILEMYLNQIYFGHGKYGVEVAAEYYFGKNAKDLTLAESALLAGIPKAPSHYSPFIDLKRSKMRQKVVLERMVTTGKITQAQADAATEAEIVLNSDTKEQDKKAPFFVEEVRKYITDHFENGSELLLQGGLKVYTTLDLDWQQAAEQALTNGLAQAPAKLEGALVAIDPQTGYVKAMVGGKDFGTSKFNRVYAKRQPGSAFKPFLYAAAIDSGYTANTLISCEPVQYKQTNNEIYQPQDYGRSPYHNRNFTLQEALVISDNVVAVKLNDQVGPQKLVEYAHKLGIESKLRSYLSLALGTSETTPLEMAAAYSTLANQGVRTKTIMITRIETQDGRVLVDNTPKLEPVLSEETAFIINNMLTGVNQPGGTASSVGAITGLRCAGKTGTSQNYQDAWYVGYTPKIAASVYIGYDQPASVGSTGGGLAAPIWANFVKTIKTEVAQDFVKPNGITMADICTDTGLLATPLSPKVMTMAFVAGTEPKETCYVHDVQSQPDDFDSLLEELQPNGPGKKKGQKRNFNEDFLQEESERVKKWREMLEQLW